MSRLALTPVQQRIMRVFSDGREHTSAEIREAIDSMCSGNNMRTHLRILRIKLREVNEDILCTVQGRERNSPGGLKLRYVHVSRIKVSVDDT